MGNKALLENVTFHSAHVCKGSGLVGEAGREAEEGVGGGEGERVTGVKLDLMRLSRL